MNKFFLFTSLLYMATTLLLPLQAQDTPLAFITTHADLAALQANGDDDEATAATWFDGTYDNGTILSTQNANEWNLSQYDAIWIAIDRTGIGASLPAEFTNPDVLDKIKAYYQNGGNLLLTNFATRYLVDLGRTTRFPGIWGDGPGGDNGDAWGLNTIIGSMYDHSQNNLYKGMNVDFAEGDGKKVYNILGAGHKEDHNSMWDLNSFGYTGVPNTVVEFEQENKATILATWQHVVDFCCAGIVFFHATETFGKCIAIGVAVYEWNQNSGTNIYQGNIELLTKNALAELSGGNSGTTTYLPETVDDHIKHIDYYTLQGLKIALPQKNGIYIVKKTFESGRSQVEKVYIE